MWIVNFILDLKLDIDAMEPDESDSSEDDTDKTVKKKHQVLVFSFFFSYFFHYLSSFSCIFQFYKRYL